MSKNADGLVTDSLNNNFTNSTSTTNVTCSLSVAPVGKERLHLTNLGWSIRNATAAAYTATLNVREASIGGAVLGSWDVIVATAGSAQDSFWYQAVPGKGLPLFVEFIPPAASVYQKVSVSGWRQQTMQD